MTLSQSSPENPTVNGGGALWEGDHMPMFLEVTQTTIMGENSEQSPVLGVGPTVYFYSPDSRVLMLHSTITLVLQRKVAHDG